MKRQAHARRVITYGEAAALVGRSTAGPMPVLAAISAEDAARGRPDLACLAVPVGTGLPRGMGRDEPAAPLSRAPKPRPSRPVRHRRRGRGAPPSYGLRQAP